MKVVKALAILLFGPLFGILVALIVGSLQLRSNPLIAANGGHTAPGDGILIMLYVLISLVAAVPSSIAAAAWVLFRKRKGQEQIETP
jgi:hypothetical protein